MFALAFILGFAAPADVVPLKHAHAHNDYEHPRPLLDALDHGFGSVEADIFLVDGALLVAHTVADLKKDRTLQTLYLDPLRERVKAKGGVHKKDLPFHLLIDVKTDAKPAYAALAKVLEQYADILSVTRDGKTEAKAVTVVVSGNCDREAIKAATVRYCAIDGRPNDLKGEEPLALIPWVSASWGSLFKWKGDGPMPESERAKLKEHVKKAHDQGRKVRFWGTPDKVECWREQFDAGVDFINTDKLKDLSDYLNSKK